MLFRIAILKSTTHTIRMSTNGTASFVPNPSGRGTLDIFWTCTFTIFLSAWTVIHSRVPRPGLSKREKLVNKLSGCLWTIFIPELTISRAYVEFAHARVLRNEVNSRITGTVNRSAVTLHVRFMSPPRHPPRNDGHGFFAEIGGLPDKESGRERTVVDLGGIIFLVQLRFLPELTKDIISAKSKSDTPSQILVVVQVFWMLIHIIARFAERLSVTALEMFAMAQAHCALRLNGF